MSAVAFLEADDTETAFSLLKPVSADLNGGTAAAQAQRVLELMARAAEPSDGEPARP